MSNENQNVQTYGIFSLTLTFKIMLFPFVYTHMHNSVVEMKYNLNYLRKSSVPETAILK